MNDLSSPYIYMDPSRSPSLKSELEAFILDIRNWLTSYKLRTSLNKDGVLNVEQFSAMLQNYKRKLLACKDNPEEIEKVGRSFEGAFPIGGQMAHLIGNLETWINHKKSRKYSMIPWGNVSVKGENTFKSNEIKLKVDNINILLSKEYAITDSEYDWRDLIIYESDKIVAKYALTRFKRAQYDWGEDFVNLGHTPITHRFTPGDWLLKLNNLYYEWLEEYKLIEKKRSQKFEMDHVKSKYL